MEEKDNLYKAPDSELIAAKTDASRISRLGAAILDSIVLFVVVFALLSLFGFWTLFTETDTGYGTEIAGALTGILVWLACNLHLVKTRGQTIGKMAANIQIVDMDSNRTPAVGNSVGKRFLLMQLFYIIPFIGHLLALVDTLFIFRSDKRCIHDLIANTKVVYYRPES